MAACLDREEGKSRSSGASLVIFGVKSGVMSEEESGSGALALT
jgi:hypothetical protein